MSWIKQGPSHFNTTDYEVQRTNHFEVYIDISSVRDVSGNVITATNQELTLMVESFPLPKISNDAIELAYGNRKVKVAGAVTYDGGDLVVKDAINKDTEKLMNDWQKAVYDVDTDAVGWAANYKTKGKVYEYAPDGSVSRVWQLFGLWVQSADYGDLGYSSGDAKTISATLSYDYAKRL